ncbi:unnamed protein product, partial [Nesidiocoris tenuis]
MLGKYKTLKFLINSQKLPSLQFPTISKNSPKKIQSRSTTSSNQNIDRTLHFQDKRTFGT